MNKSDQYSYQYFFSKYVIDVQNLKYICEFDQIYERLFTTKIYPEIVNPILEGGVSSTISEELIRSLLSSKMMVIRERVSQILKNIHERIPERKELLEIRIQDLKFIEKLIDSAREDPELFKYLSIHTLLEYLECGHLIHIILDPLISDIFIERSDIYVDHSLFGRLSTNLKLYPSQLQKFLLFSKIMTGSVIDFLVSPCRFEGEFFGQRLRISSFPQEEGEISVHIRKLMGIPPFLSFIADESTQPYLSFLISFMIVHRSNILITGETGSGKTTLSSLLIYSLPRYIRLFLIEEIPEVPPSILKDRYYNRLKVLTFEELAAGARGLTKDLALLSLLVRQPEFVFLGEAITQRDVENLLAIAAAGVRILSTIHSSSISDLIDRIISVFKINPKLLNVIDFIIIIQKRVVGRRIFRFIDGIYVPIVGEFKIWNEIPEELDIISLPEFGMKLLKVDLSRVKDFGSVIKFIGELIHLKKSIQPLHHLIDLQIKIHDEVLRAFREISKNIRSSLKENKNVFEISEYILKSLSNIRSKIEESLETAALALSLKK